MFKGLRPYWWILALIGAALVALALLTPRATGQVAAPQSVYLNLGQMYAVKGDSMLPALQDKDSLILPWGKERKPIVGQIVVYKSVSFAGGIISDIILPHRVVEIGEDREGWWAITKGDNEAEKDWFYVRENNFIGVAWGRLTIW